MIGQSRPSPSPFLYLSPPHSEALPPSFPRPTIEPRRRWTGARSLTLLLPGQSPPPDICDFTSPCTQVNMGLPCLPDTGVITRHAIAIRRLRKTHFVCKHLISELIQNAQCPTTDVGMDDTRISHDMWDLDLTLPARQELSSRIIGINSRIE